MRGHARLALRPLPADVAAVAADRARVLGWDRTARVDHDLGAAIWARRKALGWTRAETAVRLGVTVSAMGEIELGTRPLTVAALYVCAEALGTDPLQLLADVPWTDGVEAQTAIP